MVKTIPIAIAFVTYGMKKMVWNNFFKALIELSAIAIINDKIMLIGTVITVSNIVLGRAIPITLENIVPLSPPKRDHGVKTAT